LDFRSDSTAATALVFNAPISHAPMPEASGHMAKRSIRRKGHMVTQTAKGHKKGMGMEGLIATWYAQNTRKNMADYKADAKKVAAQVAEGAAILEVAPGPGYTAIELAKLGRYQITGLDISTTFVNIARENAKEARVNVDFRHGDAAQMPFPDDSFDFIYCRAAFKNFAAPVEALNEIYRVLKLGGKASIVDLRGGVSMEAISKHVNEMGVSGLNKLMTKWAFRFMLIKQAYTPDQFEGFVAKSRFEKCEFLLDEIGLDVRLVK
jgi:ubiquinone/menaquinone biosynthesis C-methylase UbiE